MRNAARIVHQTQSGFDYTFAVWKVANNICQNTLAAAHIDMQKVAVDHVRCRNDKNHGTLATLTPLRETVAGSESAGGHSAIDVNGRDVWYLLTLFLPRFACLPYREKLVTITHELWHISPQCDGRLRRFPGRFSTHGKNEKLFDAKAESIVDHWLQSDPASELSEFLHLSLGELVAAHGSVVGQRFAKTNQ